jgi:hypothetical protein
MRRQILMLLDGPIVPVYALRLSEQLRNELDCSVTFQAIPHQTSKITGLPSHWKPDLLENSMETTIQSRTTEDSAPNLVIDFRSSPDHLINTCPVIRCDFFAHARSWEFPSLVHSIIESRPIIELQMILQAAGSHEEKCIQTAQIPVTLHQYRRSLNRILSESIRLILRSAMLVLTNSEQEVIQTEKTEPSSTNFTPFRIRISILKHQIKHRYRQFTSTDVWNIAKVELPIQHLALGQSNHIEKTSWMKEPTRGSFQADPFAILGKDKNDIVLFEYYTQGRGSIVISAENRLLLSGGHFSYPYTVEYEGAHYVLPENQISGRLVLHKLNSEISGIEKSYNLLDHFHAVDPSLVFFEKRWWLFCTDASDKGADIRLHVFYSESLTGPFFPHFKNPVKTDIRSARPAGHLFIHEGKLYRPAQDSSKSYGGSIRIHRIDTINPSDFSETCINTLEPQQFGNTYTAGIHTLSICGDHCYIDGKRTRRGLFSPFKTARK